MLTQAIALALGTPLMLQALSCRIEALILDLMEGRLS
jgi:hypothetical protein